MTTPDHYDAWTPAQREHWHRLVAMQQDREQDHHDTRAEACYGLGALLIVMAVIVGVVLAV